MGPICIIMCEEWDQNVLAQVNDFNELIILIQMHYLWLGQD